MKMSIVRPYGQQIRRWEIISAVLTVFFIVARSKRKTRRSINLCQQPTVGSLGWERDCNACK